MPSPKKRIYDDKSDDLSVKKIKNVANPKLELLNNFYQGDLVFGLGTHVRKVIKDLKAGGYKGMRAVNLNDGVIELLLEYPTADKLDNLKNRRYNYYQELRKVIHFFQKEGGKPFDESSDTKNDIARRRGCKYLVRNARRDRAIHFVLDGLDMKKVTDHSPDNLGVTNSELRAIFRQVKDKSQQKNPYVFFYRNDVINPAPWEEEENKKYWDAYQEARVNKKTR